MRLVRLGVFLTPLIAIRLLAAPAGIGHVPHLPACHSTATSERCVQAPVDSPRVLEAARSHQSRFERLRRSRLYRGARSPGRRCHEIVGRYCLRHGDDEREPQPESPAVKEARDELIAQLDRAARSLPGDEWIAGQRVRYLVEAGRRLEAVEAARECRAVAGWWCTALRGYALHSAGEFESAERSFATALSSMHQDERCRWTDITDLLSGRARRKYDGLNCEGRADIEARFWWLADPLHLLPANDRRTEHFARRVLDRMQHRASSAFGEPWGSDLRELLVRYGWPGRFERVSYPTARGSSRDEIVSYNPEHSRQFAPDFDPRQEVEAIRRTDWQLDTETPRSVYAPVYASSFQELDHQLAVFPRGDSAVIVAAYQLIAEGPIDSSSYEAALIISRDPASDPVVAAGQGSVKGVLAVAVEAGPALLSLELLSRTERRAARSRYGLRLAKVPTGLLALSDLLLLDDVDTLPDSLTAAVRLARPPEHVRPGERLRMYWEVFGLGPRAEELSVSLTLAAEGPSWLRKTVEWLGLASRRQPLTLAWQEAVPSPTAVLARSLAILLPADLEPGDYTLRLEVTPSGRETLTGSRSIEVVR